MKIIRTLLRHSPLPLAMCFLLFLAGCASMRPAAPELDLIDLRIGELTLSHAHFEADLRVFNPNSVPITIRNVDYALLLNGIRMATGQSLKEAKLGAGETGNITLRVSTGYLDLLRFASARSPGEAVRYALEGAIQIGGFRILDSSFPFRREGDLDLRKLPLLRE